MKIIDAKEVGSLVKDNQTIALTSSGDVGSPDALIRSIKDSFLSSGHPSNITLTGGISAGNLTEDDIGVNMFVQDGLVKKAIFAHVGKGKLFGKAVADNKFPTFTVPLGVMNKLFRAIASKEDGIITHVGLNTFADPRLDACCANEAAKGEEKIVELININGKENLFFKTFPIDVALIKATYSDTLGNLSLAHEPITGEQYNIAIAAHNSGGIVIAQVDEIIDAKTLKARDIEIHSSLVDYVVVSPPDPSLGEYTAPVFRPETVGEKYIDTSDIPIYPLDARKVCGRRAALELKKGDVINLGVGIPESVGAICAEEGISNDITLSIEVGISGGVPLSGGSFGQAINPESIISTAEQFDAYDGGSLNMAVVGLAECDKKGNINVSKMGSMVTGPGGFINITQNTKKVVFVGTFTASGLKEEIGNGKLTILEEGKINKFVDEVQQITFSSEYATSHDQEIIYVTERAVFKLEKEGVKLIEIAPGIDLEKDILSHMDFKPIISDDLKLMDERIFTEGKMGIEL